MLKVLVALSAVVAIQAGPITAKNVGSIVKACPAEAKKCKLPKAKKTGLKCLSKLESTMDTTCKAAVDKVNNAPAKGGKGKGKGKGKGGKGGKAGGKGNARGKGGKAGGKGGKAPGKGKGGMKTVDMPPGTTQLYDKPVSGGPGGKVDWFTPCTPDLETFCDIAGDRVAAFSCLGAMFQRGADSELAPVCFDAVEARSAQAQAQMSDRASSAPAQAKVDWYTPCTTDAVDLCPDATDRVAVFSCLGVEFKKNEESQLGEQCTSAIAARSAQAQAQMPVAPPAKVDWYGECEQAGDIAGLCADMDRGATFDCLAAAWREETLTEYCSLAIEARSQQASGRGGTSTYDLVGHTFYLVEEVCKSYGCTVPNKETEDAEGLKAALVCLLDTEKVELADPQCLAELQIMVAELEAAAAPSQQTSAAATRPTTPDPDAILAQASRIISILGPVAHKCPEITCVIPTTDDMSETVMMEFMQCFGATRVNDLASTCRAALGV